MVAMFLGVDSTLLSDGSSKSEEKFRSEFLSGKFFPGKVKRKVFDQAYFEQVSENWFTRDRDFVTIVREAENMGDTIRFSLIPKKVLSPRALAFGAACAMYVGGFWNVWAKAAMEHIEVVQTIKIMNCSIFYRPRYRTLYTMGLMCAKKEFFDWFMKMFVRFFLQ